MTRRLLAVLLFSVCAACGDDGPERAGSVGLPAIEQVTIERSRFGVPDLTVAVGTTVVFVNEDPFAHTVTSVEGPDLAFDSGEMTQGAIFEITFDRPDTYHYFCEIHPTMRGTVVVA